MRSQMETSVNADGQIVMLQRVEGGAIVVDPVVHSREQSLAVAAGVIAARMSDGSFSRHQTLGSFVARVAKEAAAGTWPAQ